MAEPNGSFSYLTQFITSNLQIPFKSSIEGLDGEVYVKGTVEPDGSMSQLKISRGLDSLCNQEAIRLLNLYKAWTPAILNGERVRQSIIYPIKFSASPQITFDSLRWCIVQYYDANYLPTTDKIKYKNRSSMAVDEHGNIKADIKFETWVSGRWRQTFSMPFYRKDLWYKTQEGSNLDSLKAYQLSAELVYVPVKIFQTNGRLLEYRESKSGRKPVLHKYYYPNGLLSKVKVFSDSTSDDINYFDNGQIASIIENPINAMDGTNEKKVLSIWDRDGNQKIKDGNGWWKFITKDNEGNNLVEEGKIVLGLRSGKWIGKHADSTLYYEEIYEMGKLHSGICYTNGEKISYQSKVIDPVFSKGDTAFYQFLGKNIKYPKSALKKGISGIVFLSFVVCEDGSLCDYEVIKGIQPDMDNEALRVVKIMSGQWKPGILRGQKVRVKYSLPVNFALQ